MSKYLSFKLILQMWKADSVPTFEMWARELGNVLIQSFNVLGSKVMYSVTAKGV